VAARSTKIRDPGPCPDLEQLGSFPPPTPWSEQLAADNLGLARAMANRLASRTKMGFDDLYLVAVQGLLNGCRRYDPKRINIATGRPYALSTAVVPFIRGAMAQYLRDRGHSSGVKFPDRWRDKAPTVRRLAAADQPLSAIAEATGLQRGEVAEILEAQGATRCFDPDAQGYAFCDPDPLDEAEGHRELAEALALADRAHEALSWADQQMIERSWLLPRGRRTLRGLQFGQFIIRARRIRQGQQLQHEEHQGLTLELAPSTTAEGQAKRRRITQPAEILQAAEQLALFGTCCDQGSGKTAAAGVGGDVGAAEAQPSDNQGGAAVVPPSAPAGAPAAA